MPFTDEEVSIAGKYAIDYHLKNKPIDQIQTERPWLKKLMATKKSYPGGKENITENLRYRYQSNFQFFNGRKVVTYNNRHTVEQAYYPFRGAHDGFALDEDRLIQNGITVTDNKTARHSEAEAVQLTDLLEEQIEVMRLGFDEKFDQYLLRDGTGSTDDITGLDALVSTTPTTGTVGGINRATTGNEYWRNFVSLNLTTTTTTGTILDEMETMWRSCTRNGGRPDFIMAGSDFIDGYRNFMLKTYMTLNFRGGGTFNIEGGTEQLSFHGVPVVWNPVFEDLDTLLSPSPTWEKRCYFINTKFMRLRPIDGQDMIARKPPRPYDRYEHYWGLTWRGALTMSRGNAHAVLTIA